MSETSQLSFAELEAKVARLTQELEQTRQELRDILGANNSIAAALFRSEERLRLIIDTIPAQISYFDHDQIYRYANKGYSNWFNLPRSEVIGASIVRVWGEESYQAIRPYILRALSGETVTHEYTLPCHGGRQVDARSTLVPEINPDGTPVGCFEFSFDITETRRMQAALAQAQKMEAIGQLTGGVAHDFNNLLTIICGNLSMLKERFPERTDMRELVEPSLRAASRGAQLVQGLLSFSRQQPLKPVVVDVGKLILDMQPLIRHSLPSSIQFRVLLSGEALHLLIDPGQLESALLNFALNARDAMPEGGELIIRARPGVLSESEARPHKLEPGPYILIEVTDTGCGMEEATRNRVFEPFFTTKGFGRGSGLGLSMIYGFARQSGGSIGVTSLPDKGSTFSLILPPAPPGSHEESRPEEAGLVRAHPGDLVLLVEDEPDVRHVVREQLLDLGYLVLEAENGNQAGEILAQVAEITVILTDVIMPGGINGREFARQALKERPGLHVVLMSGYDQAAAPGQGDGFAPRLLEKPFSKRRLADALKPGD
ncbi:MAG: PAS domain-containing protein [Zoogloeaceae bacterium]|nr:PAS domain-containing protein [Zoogloeaceae bacterium]